MFLSRCKRPFIPESGSWTADSLTHNNSLGELRERTWQNPPSAACSFTLDRGTQIDFQENVRNKYRISTGQPCDIILRQSIRQCLVVLHWNIYTQIGIIPYVCYEYSCLSPLLYHRNWGKICQSNEDSTHELFFLFLFCPFCDVAKLMIIHKRI